MEISSAQSKDQQGTEKPMGRTDFPSRCVRTLARRGGRVLSLLVRPEAKVQSWDEIEAEVSRVSSGCALG